MKAELYRLGKVMQLLRPLVILIAIFVSSYASAAWSPVYEIKTNYFQPIGTTDQSIILTFDTSFHECGWNTAGQVQESKVGKDFFKTITSVMLSAIMANKKVSILTPDTSADYCDGTKVKIIGIRLMQ